MHTFSIPEGSLFALAETVERLVRARFKTERLTSLAPDSVTGLAEELRDTWGVSIDAATTYIKGIAAKVAIKLTFEHSA